MTLDFVCIGAQKAGTTSLHRFLAAHPGIVVPPDKEVPLFSRDDLSLDQVRTELRAVLTGPRPGSVRCGKVTPHYLTSPIAAKRLAAVAPDAAIMIVVRNRLERAASHYRMMCRLRLETRTFDESVRGELDRLEAGVQPDPAGYVSGGLYGHHLRPYSEHFSPDSISVIDMVTLAGDTSRLAALLGSLLGVEADGFPASVPHANPSGRPGLIERSYYRSRQSTVARRLVQAATNEWMRRRLYWNIQGRRRVPDDGIDISLSPDTAARFAEATARDQQRLDRIGDRMQRVGNGPKPGAGPA